MRLISVLFVLLATLLLSACGKPPVTQESYVFGTRVELLVVGAPEATAREAGNAVLREFDRLHRTYHAWQPSDLTALNNAFATSRTVPVSKEMAALITEAQDIARQSNGLFDPGIGALIKLWGFHADEFIPHLPDEASINGWRISHPSILDIRVKDGFASSSKRMVALDFGGYLKGVALDRAADILRQHGIHHALINIGGNVLALGNRAGKPDGDPWRVGIRAPRGTGVLASVLLYDGEAIGTSGDYQRFFEIGGKRYCHLLDPRTGYPVEHTAALTILMPPGPKAGMWSDAASKPMFLAGPTGWRKEAEKLGISQVLRVDADGSLEATRAMAARLRFEGEPPAIRLVD
jgi:thiamine biosynthesis lipoprotein